MTKILVCMYNLRDNLLYKCFGVDYAHLFDSPVNSKIDNDVSGHSPTYIPAAG